MPWRKALTGLLSACALLTWAQAPVEANRATEAQLDGIRGIGPGLSSRILTARQQGSFTDWKDFIARVPGVGHSRAARLSTEGLTVAGQAYAPSAASSSPQSAPNRP